MAKTRHLTVGLLLAAIAIAALTYLGRDVPSAPALTAPTVADGTLPGGAVTGLNAAPGRPQLAELERLIRAF
ncbi:MAG TPA: hypothetical protein VLA82_14005, partial [Actinomycetota bacterium]|nr:hypothetical protein [Actinomycetota bacterium]